jgi:hypothetical protein
MPFILQNLCLRFSNPPNLCKTAHRLDEYRITVYTYVYQRPKGRIFYSPHYLPKPLKTPEMFFTYGSPRLGIE